MIQVKTRKSAELWKRTSSHRLGALLHSQCLGLALLDLIRRLRSASVQKLAPPARASARQSLDRPKVVMLRYSSCRCMVSCNLSQLSVLLSLIYAARDKHSAETDSQKPGRQVVLELGQLVCINSIRLGCFGSKPGQLWLPSNLPHMHLRLKLVHLD